MRHGDRAALLDLSIEQWYHAARRRKHISETNYAERTAIGAGVCDGQNLAEPLCHAKNVDWFDGLVRGYEHESLDSAIRCACQ